MGDIIDTTSPKGQESVKNALIILEYLQKNVAGEALMIAALYCIFKEGTLGAPLLSFKQFTAGFEILRVHGWVRRIRDRDTRKLYWILN